MDVAAKETGPVNDQVIPEISVKDPYTTSVLLPDVVVNTGALGAPVQSMSLQDAVATSTVTVLFTLVNPELASKYTLFADPGTCPHAGPPLMNDQWADWLQLPVPPIQ